MQILPILLGKNKEFGDLTGFYINKIKSKVMWKIMKNPQKDLQEQIGCQLTTKVKYLGVILRMKNINLF